MCWRFDFRACDGPLRQRESIDYIEAAAQNSVLSGTFFFIVNQEGLVGNPMHLFVNNLDIFDKCRISPCQFSVKH